MLSFQPGALRATPNDAANPGGSAGSPPSFNADPAGFASLLRQTQAQPAPLPLTLPAAAPRQPTDALGAGAAPTPAPEADAAAEPAEPAPATPAASRPRAAAKAPPRARDDAGPQRANDTPGGDAAPAPATPADPASGTAAAVPANGRDAAVDPGILHWLAGLQRAAAARPDTDRATGTAGTETPSDEARAALGAKGTRPADPKADADASDRAATSRSARDAAAAGPALFAAALDEAHAAEPTPPAGRPTDALHPAAGSAAATAPLPAPADSAAPLAVAIATPVDAPDFAQALGLQMSVLARDGVQQAELQLNPAGMGPVSVQITMDGTQAHVAFGADAAATRQAIEAGLPQLASALQDAGFTLAGGGVSQHSRGSGQRDGGGAARSERRLKAVGDDALARVGTAARRVVTAGGIDLFA